MDLKAIGVFVVENLGLITLGALVVFAFILVVLIYLVVRTKANRKRINRKPSANRVRELAREELDGEAQEAVDAALEAAIDAAIKEAVKKKKLATPATVAAHLREKYLSKKKVEGTFAKAEALEELEARREKDLEDLRTERDQALERTGSGLMEAIMVRATGQQFEAVEAEVKEHRLRLEKLEGGLDVSLDSDPPEEEPGAALTRRAGATMPPAKGKRERTTLRPPSQNAPSQKKPERSSGPSTQVWEDPSKKRTGQWEDPSKKRTVLQDGNKPENPTLIQGDGDGDDNKDTLIKDPEMKMGQVEGRRTHQRHHAHRSSNVIVGLGVGAGLGAKVAAISHVHRVSPGMIHTDCIGGALHF